MSGTPDLPDGFFRLPGHGNTILHRSAVIGVQYVPATPAREQYMVTYILCTGPTAERVEITIQGGRQYVVEHVTFWQVLEWLR